MINVTVVSVFNIVNSQQTMYRRIIFYMVHEIETVPSHTIIKREFL